MSKSPSWLKGKKVLVVGIGLHGGGASVITYLLAAGAHIRVTDLKTRKDLRQTLSKFKKIRGTFGKHDTNDVVWADIIIKNPGVPKESQLMAFAKKLKKPIASDLTLFLEERKRHIDVAVTGTRGKSTTTAIIGHVVSQYSSVFVGGNNRNAILHALKTKNALVICELSSWQIEDTTHPLLFPRVGVFTNIYQDHLNRYSSMRDYFSAKAKLFLGQTARDVAVLNYDQKEIRNFGNKLVAKKMWFSLHKLPAHVSGAYLSREKFYFQQNRNSHYVCDRHDVRLMGEHNTQNILAAIACLSALSIPLARISRPLKSFAGLPGRCQFIKKKKGISFYNDTTATSPDALVACIQTLRKEFPEAKLHMIVGGSTKNVSYVPLQRIHNKEKISWYFLKGSATGQIAKALGVGKSFRMYVDLKKAVTAAYRSAISSDIIALSPGAASFGMFVHEFDRGDIFNRIVRKLS